MNTHPLSSKTVLIVSIASVLMAACAAAPTRPEGAAALRTRLSQLQADPQLASRAPLAMKEAEQAVAAAEVPQSDRALATHLVFMADRKIGIAEARARDHQLVDQRKTLGEQRDAMRLKSRTQEADTANERAAVARADARAQRQETGAANVRAALAEADASTQKMDADNARAQTAEAQKNSQDLQRQIDGLQAKATDRGLVVTLGDVLFATNTSTLNSSTDGHLAKLAAFLNKYPERTSLIEGHTDSMGSDDYNQGLSQRRADAVKSYLVNQGIDASRLTSTGKGESDPVGNNASTSGRQQNRRVEVIISNTLQSSR